MRKHKPWITTFFVTAFIIGVAVIGQKTARAVATANGTGSATAFIIYGISISAPSRALAFGEASQGTAAKTIAPADGTSAEFTVSGEGGHAYTVSFAPAYSVTMLRATGTPGVAADEIVVNTFTSSPSGAAGLLSGGAGTVGTQSLTVGASRAAIPETQNPGSYTIPFTVTVAYP